MEALEKLLAYPTPLNRPRIVKIETVKTETPKIKTFTFKDDLCAKAKPGQFVMVWVLGIGEVPMSISMVGPKNIVGICVAKVGKTTTALHQKKVGDLIGVRGPYGNSFKPVAGKVLIVGGGCGVAPLLPLAKTLTKKKAKITFIFGIKTRNALFFLDKIKASLSKTNSKLIITTDDGSYGIKGYASDPVKGLLNSQKFDMIYTCGREQLMWEVFKQAERRGVPIQANLERYLKCGIGICGQCVLDPLGLRVCKDGPIFSSEVLRRLTDFGAYMRDATGRKIPI